MLVRLPILHLSKLICKFRKNSLFSISEDIVELGTNLSSTLHKVEELITKKANEAKFGELESGHDEIKSKAKSNHEQHNPNIPCPSIGQNCV